MEDNHSYFTLYGKSPLYQLFFSLMIILVAGVILLYAMLWAGAKIFHADWATLLKTISETMVKSVEDGGLISNLYLKTD